MITLRRRSEAKNSTSFKTCLWRIRKTKTCLALSNLLVNIDPLQGTLMDIQITPRLSTSEMMKVRITPSHLVRSRVSLDLQSWVTSVTLQICQPKSTSSKKTSSKSSPRLQALIDSPKIDLASTQTAILRTTRATSKIYRTLLCARTSKSKQTKALTTPSRLCSKEDSTRPPCQTKVSRLTSQQTHRNFTRILQSKSPLRWLRLQILLSQNKLHRLRNKTRSSWSKSRKTIKRRRCSVQALKGWTTETI